MKTLWSGRKKSGLFSWSPKECNNSNGWHQQKIDVNTICKTIFLTEEHMDHPSEQGAHHHWCCVRRGQVILSEDVDESIPGNLGLSPSRLLDCVISPSEEIRMEVSHVNSSISKQRTWGPSVTFQPLNFNKKWEVLEARGKAHMVKHRHRNVRTQVQSLSAHLKARCFSQLQPHH